MTKEYLAKWLHDNYESLAKEKNWQTQQNCKVEFDNLPSENKELMLSLADRLQNTFLIIDDQANVSGQVCPKCNVVMEGATYKGCKMCHICREWQTLR